MDYYSYFFLVLWIDKNIKPQINDVFDECQRKLQELKYYLYDNVWDLQERMEGEFNYLLHQKEIDKAIEKITNELDEENKEGTPDRVPAKRTMSKKLQNLFNKTKQLLNNLKGK